VTGWRPFVHEETNRWNFDWVADLRQAMATLVARVIQDKYWGFQTKEGLRSVCLKGLDDIILLRVSHLMEERENESGIRGEIRLGQAIFPPL
jgi:hypothetical protein